MTGLLAKEYMKNKTTKRLPNSAGKINSTRISEYKLRIGEVMKYSKVSEYGLTEKELREYFADSLQKKFGKWIDGQTCAVTPDRQIVIYPEDIQRFMAMVFEGKPTYWD